VNGDLLFSAAAISCILLLWWTLFVDREVCLRVGRQVAVLICVCVYVCVCMCVDADRFCSRSVPGLIRMYRANYSTLLLRLLLLLLRHPLLLCSSLSSFSRGGGGGDDDDDDDTPGVRVIWSPRSTVLPNNERNPPSPSVPRLPSPQQLLIYLFFSAQFSDLVPSEGCSNPQSMTARSSSGFSTKSLKFDVWIPT